MTETVAYFSSVLEDSGRTQIRFRIKIFYANKEEKLGRIAQQNVYSPIFPHLTLLCIKLNCKPCDDNVMLAIYYYYYYFRSDEE